MKSKKFAVLVAVIMCFAVFVLTVSPSAVALTDKKGSISLHLADSATGKPLEDASFRLYFVARVSKSGDGLKYDFVSPFGESEFNPDDLQDPSFAIHLAYVAKVNSALYIEKSTDKNGNLVFDNLTPGLYLIVPSEEVEGYYISSPFVVSVPEYDVDKKEWIYDIDASPKIDAKEDADDTDTYISVVKKWETVKEHPDSVKIVLLRNFEEFAKIELNEENNWYYRWDGLSKDFIWSVVESQVPDGYKVYYETSSNTVTIINKHKDVDEPTTKPDSTPTTEQDTDEKTTVPMKPSEPDDDLAHTGQLNWPVPVFAISGLLLFSIGWAILNLGKKESE